MSEQERITMDDIPLKKQFECWCSRYLEMQNEIDLVEQELSEWEDRHKELLRTGTPEEILKHYDVYREITNRRDKKYVLRNANAGRVADFSIENRDLILAALELADKKKELPIRTNRPRRGR